MNYLDQQKNQHSKKSEHEIAKALIFGKDDSEKNHPLFKKSIIESKQSFEEKVNLKRTMTTKLV